MVDAAPRSGLILEVPEAEEAVGRHRLALDANARLGVPAHCTVLFPFVPSTQIDGGVLAELRRLFAGTAGFDFSLTHSAWFGDEVLWLAPADPEPFRALTELVQRAFPSMTPYEGRFDRIVPHLTVAHGGDLTIMQAVERSLGQQLPVRGQAREVTLIVQSIGSPRWAKRATFPLASPAGH
jgi:2'-5' RNA ligase